MQVSDMKLTYKNLSTKPSLLKSATGLNMKEFNFLLPSFTTEWENYIWYYTLEGKARKRKSKPRKNSHFKTVDDMLIFILYDYRHNPTQEFMGLHFSLTQPKVALWLSLLDPILEKCLATMKLTPARSNKGLNDRIIESATVLFDGSERPINRPMYDQKEYFSGKKSTIPLKII